MYFVSFREFYKLKQNVLQQWWLNDVILDEFKVCICFKIPNIDSLLYVIISTIKKTCILYVIIIKNPTKFYDKIYLKNML